MKRQGYAMRKSVSETTPTYLVMNFGAIAPTGFHDRFIF